MPAGRGRQAPLENGCRPYGAKHVGAGAALARKPVRPPEGTLDGVSGHRQRIQLHAVGQDSGSPGTLRGSQLPRSTDPRLPRRQVGMLRQQGGAGKAARRARRSAELGVGTYPVNHRVRRGTALSAASGCYADDTLVLVGGRGWHETLRIGEIATACVIRVVRGLSLRVSVAKLEAI